MTGRIDSSGEGEVTGLSFEGCTTCPTVRGAGFPWDLQAQSDAPADGNGSVVVEDPEILMEGYFGFTNCQATAKSMKFTMTGGNPATLAVENAPLSVKTTRGFGCGSAMTFKAEYVLDQPETGTWLY
jgi:hypothetical protein